MQTRINNVWTIKINRFDVIGRKLSKTLTSRNGSIYFFNSRYSFLVFITGQKSMTIEYI